MRVGVVGSREEHWKNAGDARQAVVELVNSFPPDTVVVSGGAKGVDTWAVLAAKARGLPWKEHKPDYQKYPPKVAPMMRNQTIVDDSDEVYAIWDGASRGTRDAMKRAEKAGKLKKVIYPEESPESAP